MAFNKHILNNTLRLFAGLIFILSAVLKLISIDTFEVYVYSFKILSLNSAFIFARLLISFETLLGLLFVFNLRFRSAKYASLGLLFVFTGFLIFNINSDENCHCFGEMLEMTPLESIIKNLVLIGIILLVNPGRTHKSGTNQILTVSFILFSLATPMILSPPDLLYKKIYPVKTEVDYRTYEALFNSENGLPSELKAGKKIVCFFGPTCRFCQMTGHIITVISQKSGIDHNDIRYVFFGSQNQIDRFFDKSESFKFKYSVLPSKDFLQITQGKMPLILLTEDGVIKNKFSYRNLNEREIVAFFNRD